MLNRDYSCDVDEDDLNLSSHQAAATAAARRDRDRRRERRFCLVSACWSRRSLTIRAPMVLP